MDQRNPVGATLRVLSTPQIDPFLLGRICELKQTGWDYPLERHVAWFHATVGPDDRHVLAEAADALVGYIRLPHFLGACAGNPVRVWGVSTVIVHPDLRGRELGKEMVGLATEVIRDDPLAERHPGIGAMGLLRCGPRLAGFYGRCGWIDFEGGVVRGTATGSEPWGLGERIMTCSASPRGPLEFTGDNF